MAVAPAQQFWARSATLMPPPRWQLDADAGTLPMLITGATLRVYNDAFEQVRLAN